MTNNGECASPFAVQSHVFGVGLSKTNIVAILEELSYGKGISVHIARGKSLIGHVKEGIELTVFDQLRQFFPLLGTRVDSRGIVSTGVQQNDAILRDFLWVFKNSLVGGFAAYIHRCYTLISSQAAAKSRPQVLGS